MLRAIAIAAQLSVSAVAYQLLELRRMNWHPIWATIAALGVLNLLTWLRLRSNRPVSNAELFAQLCADVLALTVLLYYSGGSTNPFVSLFLLPLVIAAATLPHRYTWAMTVVTTGCYTLLMKYYVPLPLLRGGMDHDLSGMDDMPMEGMGMEAAPDSIFNLHVIGMWLGFVISAVIVSWFVARMAHAVRERDAALARVREETLRNERIVALGTQAAGAAHELGTPLSTMAVIVGELKREPETSPEWSASLDILDAQIRACKHRLNKLLADAQSNDNAAMPQQFIAEVLDEWQLLRPTVRYRCDIAAADWPQRRMSADPSLRAALLNLLNNAADASPDGIVMTARHDADNFILSIHDHGAGLTPDVAAHAGAAFFSTKDEGHGSGLFLANATIERLGGKVRLFNRDEGGATTEITLPLQPELP
jgi:two-component system sensor histidine kinase RegB